jgi:hypothetical protein
MLSAERTAALSASLPRPKSPRGYRIAKGRPAVQRAAKSREQHGSLLEDTAPTLTATFLKVTLVYSFAKIAQVERIDGLYT